MLQFYYEFLDFYLDRRDFELIQMDTDSMYFALSRERLEDAIPSWVRDPVRGGKEALAGLEQVEQPRARFIQAREGGHQWYRTLQQMLPHGGPGHRQGEGVLQGSQQAAERDASGAFRAGPLLAIGMWWSTEASECGTAQCTRTSSASSV